jgi:hypothetical protein
MTALTWSLVPDDRRKVILEERSRPADAYMLTPRQHATRDNREYLMAPDDDGHGWWVGQEVDGRLVGRWLHFPSEVAAKDQAEEWESGHE